MHRRAANVAIGRLEPHAPDSLRRRGYLDAVLEAREFGEPRVPEPLALVRRAGRGASPALPLDASQRQALQPAAGESPAPATPDL